MIRLNPFRVAVVSLAVACVACPGSLEDPGRFTSSTTGTSCADVPTTVFLGVCAASAGCHSSTDKQLGLDLQSPDVASRLIGTKAAGGPGLLIDPSNPAGSVLYTKLTAMPPFGARMPFARPALDDATIACVLQWITTEVSDGGTTDGAASPEASSEDGPSGEDGSPAGEDGSSPEDATVGQPDTGSPPPVDAGKTMDAKAPPRDASNPPVDASQPKDSGGGTPPADAAHD